MISDDAKNLLLAQATTTYLLGGLLGAPYEEDGCLKFVRRLLLELGVEIDDPPAGDLSLDIVRAYGKEFERVEAGLAQFGDVAVFQNLSFAKFHVALMLDHQWAIQSDRSTGGVGRINIMRDPWATALRGFYRHKKFMEDL